MPLIQRLGEVLICAGVALITAVPTAQAAVERVDDRYDVVPDRLERILCDAGVPWLHCRSL